MNRLDFAPYALFFIIISFALCLLVWYIQSTIKQMEIKLSETIAFMRWVKSRYDITRIYTLCRFQEILIKEGQYENAAKVKKILDNKMSDLNKL
ncbi:hypothetical protein [Bacteroides caccae]|uniref:hypothetical protein n=1 Tax=Bacteroides caccae TaxID=47678 RepID=UPI003561724E